MDQSYGYSNLNELLFDADETRGGTLRILRTSSDGDYVVVEKERVTVDTFFSDVLHGDSRPKRQVVSRTQQQRRDLEEPLI